MSAGDSSPKPCPPPNSPSSAGARSGFSWRSTATSAWLGKERFQDVELKTTQFSTLLALEWQFEAGASVELQYLLSEGVAEEIEDFSDPSHEITLGLKVEITPMTVLEFGLIENAVTSDNSPDFGLHVGLLWRF